MDIYNPLLFQQLAPFLLINDSKCSGSDVASQLKSTFKTYDVSGQIWDNCIIKNRLSASKFIVKYTDSWNIAVKLKDRRQSDQLDRENGGIRESHSELSPFNPSSDIYPNGIVSEAWFEKYISVLPFAYVAVLQLPELETNDHFLIQELIELKAKYLSYNIKFVCIILSSNQSPTPNHEDDRIDRIRQQTGLPRLHGLFYVYANPSKNQNIARDITVVVSTLLSNMKNPAVEFYSHIESKIKQRNRKYYSYPSASNITTNIELTPTFLETRNLIKQGFLSQFSNPHNIELSLKYLVPAYDNLIDILRENYLKADKNAVLPHDIKVYSHFRLLLDMLAFHIVRCYLGMEDPISALRKHKTHIASVLETFADPSSPALYDWISIQYEWLAALIQQVPSSIHVEPNPKKFGNTTTFFFGGVQFLDKGLKYDIITEPGLLFMKAAEYLSAFSPRAQSNNVEFKLLPSYGDDSQSELKRKSIGLLIKARESIQNEPSTTSNTKPSPSSGKSFSSYLSYIDWNIAEDYCELSDYEMAIEYYRKCLSTSGQFKSLILQKMLECYTHIGGGERDAVETALQISTLEEPVFKKAVDLTNVINKVQEVSGAFVKVKPVITNTQVSQPTTYLYDDCLLQLEIASFVDFDKLKTLLGVNEASITIKQLRIKFNSPGGFEDVTLNHQTSNNIPVQNVDLDVQGRGSANLAINTLNESKFIQFHQVANKIGTYQIKSIELDTEIDIDGKNLSHVQVISYSENTVSELAHHVRIYSESRQNTNESILADYKYKDIRLNGVPPYSITVFPVQPEVEFELQNPPQSIIIGENLKIPVSLKIKEKKGVDYKMLTIICNVKVAGATNTDSFTIRTSWNDLKDDEPLLLEGLAEGSTWLNLCIQSPPSMEIKGDKLLLDFKLLLNEPERKDGDEEPIYPTVFDLNNSEFNIIKEPFEFKFGITPRYRNNPFRDNDMPNPFIIKEGSPISMPVVTRTWLAKVNYVDKLVATSLNDIVIVSSDVSIKSLNPDVQVKLLEKEGSETSSETSSETKSPDTPVTDLSRSFITTSKTGYTHRNVVVSSVASIRWKRKGSDIVNEFKGKYWEVTLPLADPRALFVIKTIKKDAAGKFQPSTSSKAYHDGDIINLHYVIENPTPRIFTFTTQVVAESSSGWEYIDELNLIPSVQPAFPVLPFSRHVMDFYVYYRGNKETGEGIKLPQFRVYDVNYKVALPILSVSEDIVTSEGSLLWNA